MKPSKYAFASAVFLAVGCGWFDDGRVCKEGEFSCDGDEVRICMPGVGEAAGPHGPKTNWETVETCEDDPRAGRRTCAMNGESASCVAEAADGGAANPEHEEEQQVLRVDVSSTGELLDVQTQSLHGLPMSPVSGAFAIVTYRDATPLDAVLASPDDEGATAWVRAADATSLAVVDKAGARLAERSLAVGAASSALRERVAHLSAEMPPTLRIVTAEMKRRPPLEWLLAGLDVRAPTAEMLTLVGSALLQVPTAGLSGLTHVAFMDSPKNVVDAGSEAGVQDAGGVDVDGGVVEELPAIKHDRAVLQGTTLWIDVSAQRLAEYRASEGAGRELGLELVRLAGVAFYNVATIMKRAERFPALIPSDFPHELNELIRSRISPMLEANESFADVWSKLHWAGVTSGLSARYGGRYTDKEAVDVGFAAARGAAAGDLDFAEYMGRVTVAGAWPDGPCADLRGRKLEELPPRRFMNITKLEALRGLGVVEGDRVADCIGGLESKVHSSAVVLHKPNGEQVWFEKDATGARTGWSDSVSVLATARKDAIQAVLNIQYQGVGLPGVIRVGKPANALAETQSATFGLTDSRNYQTTGAEGGLVVLDRVTRTGVEAHLLMLHIAQPKLKLEDILKQPELVDGPWGTWFFPLVTVRVAAEVGWQDDEGSDVQP